MWKTLMSNNDNNKPERLKNKKTNDHAYPRDDVDRWYVSRKEGGRGLTSIEDSVDASIQRLDIERRGGQLITATRNNTDNMRINRTEITRKQNCEKNNFMDVLSD